MPIGVPVCIFITELVMFGNVCTNLSYYPKISYGRSSILKWFPPPSLITIYLFRIFIESSTVSAINTVPHDEYTHG